MTILRSAAGALALSLLRFAHSDWQQSPYGHGVAGVQISPGKWVMVTEIDA